MAKEVSETSLARQPADGREKQKGIKNNQETFEKYSAFWSSMERVQKTL